MDAPDGVNGRPRDDRDEALQDDLDAGSVLSSPADIASAGRSCMAILVLAAVILLLLCVWIGIRSSGVGQ
jgi:cobalamin biosynthesis Mg chelatase CobN